ncbi:AAA family ATPase [Sulfuricaulis sp.]|jgi:predicted ATPase|uniref:AAA family ATPase n=1 Tax=Sulfuricaulis sp. TaxID=2003553 RepID=UPI00355AC535
MNIKTIRLQNFRGFQDVQIELKPLTVLLGPNSAGKSAFGHALAAMAHAHKLYAAGAPGPVSLTPPVKFADAWPVDLGKTSDLRTVGAEGPVCIGLETASGDWLELGFGGLEEPTPDLLISYILHPSEQGRATSTPTSATVVSGEQNASTVASEPTTIVKPLGVPGSVVPVPPEIGAPIKLKRLNVQQWQDDWSVILKGLSVFTVVQPTTGKEQTLSGAARESLRSLLENLTYLRATRKRPSRGYLHDAGKQQIGYSGEWTPSILHEKGSEQVTYFEPPYIPKSVDEARKNDSSWKAKQKTLLEGVGAWLSRLTLATAIETVPPTALDNRVKLRATLKEQGSHDITEIGFGVSQVIPVLVAGLLQPKDSLLIVDLPEAHLHPRPQGELADFFCSQALSGKTSLVETHSEMFFHRLRLRAAQDPSLMDKIAVYFIDEPKKDGFCSKPRPVGLGYDEELRWPEGFLQEAYETEMQINAVRQSRETHS